MRGARLLLVLVFALGYAVQAKAEDAVGCDGLSDYSTAMLAAGQSYIDAMGDAGLGLDRDILSYSPDDFRTVSELADQFQSDMKDISPPDFASEWHQAQIEHSGLVAQATAAAADKGVFAMIAYGDAIDADDQRRKDTAAEATGVCADFAAFVSEWDLLDGVVDSATPESATSDTVPFRHTGKVGDSWKVRITDVFADVKEIDPTATWFNDWVDANPPPIGYSYFAIHMEIENVGTEADYPLMALYFQLASPTNYKYGSDVSCGNIPGGLTYMLQMDVGDRLETNQCWIVKSNDVDTVELMVNPSLSMTSNDPVRFALKPAP